MGVRIVRARPEHAPAIVDNLSQHAHREIENIGRAKDEIVDEIEGSVYANVGLHDGKVAVLWGVRMVSLLERTGFIWAITTRLVEDYPFLFARHSKIAVDELMAEFDVLHGVVLPEFDRSKRWLKSLGFEILPVREILGKQYHPFIRRA